MIGKNTAQSILKLSPVLDLNAASVLHSEFTELRGSPIEVDASEVERVGVQCAQVFVSALQSWQADGVPFSISKSSDAFDKTLKLIGIEIDQMLLKEMQK